MTPIINRLETLRTRAEERLADHPILIVILRDHLARIVLLTLLLLAVAFIAFILPLWRVGPDSLTPRFRISGLYLVQSFMLERSADASVAAGAPSDAVAKLERAVRRNPYNFGAARKLVSLVPHWPRMDRPAATSLLKHAFWLLKGTETNTADLELCVSSLQTANLQEYASALLALPQATNLSPLTRINLALPPLMLSGNFNQAMSLLHAAQTPGPNVTPVTNNVATSLLTALRQDPARLPSPPENDPNHLRLHLAVVSHLKQPEAAARTLERLTGINKDTPMDHRLAWLAHDSISNAFTAVSAQADPPCMPRTCSELEALITTTAEHAPRRWLARWATDSLESLPCAASLVPVWRQLFTSRKLWEELLAFASLVRRQSVQGSPQEAIAVEMHALALLRTGDAATARELVTEMTQSPAPDPRLGVRLAGLLMELGSPAAAHAYLAGTLTNLPPNGGTLPMELLQIAAETSDPEWILKVAREIGNALPNDPAARNNLAAALLVVRNNPQEALRLTFELISQGHRSPLILVNHALALTLSARSTEARTLLDSIDEQSLPPAHRPWLQIARTEVAAAFGEVDRKSNLNRILEHPATPGFLRLYPR